MMDRLAIYKKALDIALASTALGDLDNGLCHYLTDAVLQLYHNSTYRKAWRNDDEATLFENAWLSVSNGINGVTSLFPEIAAHKPRKALSYWFPTTEEGRIMRLHILKHAIELAGEDYSSKEDFDANHFDGDSSYNE